MALFASFALVNDTHCSYDEMQSQWPHRAPETYSEAYSETSSVETHLKNSPGRGGFSRPLSSCTRPSSAPPDHCPSTTFHLHSDVPDTNPEYIGQLWNTVMTEVAPRRSDKDGVVTRGALSSENVELVNLEETLLDSECASPYDADFGRLVLPAYKIEFFPTGSRPELLETKIQRNPDQQRRADEKIQMLQELKWWQKNDDYGEIAREYDRMVSDGLNEREFMVYAWETIFAREPLSTFRSTLTDGKLVPVRLLQQVCEPMLSEDPAANEDPESMVSETWKTPPLFGTELKKYKWDIRPDCSFAVSLRAFDEDLTGLAENYVVVMSRRAICPYLTIEFQKSPTIRTAYHQVVAASAIALYNRYRLKCRVRGQGKWSKEDYRQLRHYGITFQSSRWELFCTVPKTTLYGTVPQTELKVWSLETETSDKKELDALVWNGCTMHKIADGDCRYAINVDILFTTLWRFINGGCTPTGSLVDKTLRNFNLGRVTRGRLRSGN